MGKKQRKIKQIWLIITQSTWQILFEWPFPRITYRKEQSHVQRWHRSLFSTAAQRNIFFLWKRKMHVYVVCEKFWKKYWLVTGCIYKHHLDLMCCTFEFDWIIKVTILVWSFCLCVFKQRHRDSKWHLVDIALLFCYFRC